MNRLFYPNILVCGLLCFFIIPALANANGLAAPFQTPATSFISKPLNNSVANAAPYLKVTANVVTDAKRYTIELNTAPDFTGQSFIRTSTNDYERTLLFTGLAYSTTYYGRVKTDISPLYGKVTKFQTRGEMFPVVVSPSNGVDEQNPQVLKIQVAAIPDAKRYWVELNTNADFSGSSVLLNAVEDYQREFIVRGVRYATTYYTRARTDINTAFGPTTKFTTRAVISQKRLWGLTASGGAHEFGTVFSFSIDSAKFLKHHDYIENSEYPVAYAHGTLVPAPDGGFYGNSECANSGTCGNGEVFYISPSGEYQYRSGPGIHAGNLMLASNNHLYVLHDWVNTFRGGIIRQHADSVGFDMSSIIYKFSARANGLNPKAALLEHSNGYLYGMAPYGGNTGHGVIYRIRHNGSGFQVMYHFTLSESGGYPQGGLVIGADGYLYGTTQDGGSFNYGTIFKILPDGTNFTKIHDFTGSSGKYPQCTLAHNNGVLFGTTRLGGNSDLGVVFKLNINGTGYQKLYNFSGLTGGEPLAAPTIDPAGFLYGMTSRGGSSDLGVIYKLGTNGSSYSKLFDFTHESGGTPDGSLVLVEDLFPTSGGTLVAQAFENVKQQTSYTVGVFPNPSNSAFTADIQSEDDSPVQVVISDMHGQILARKEGRTNAAVQLGDNLERGIYVLKVIKNGEVSQHRIVKR
jgi:uncharacterized repeat protein (TIGR03803 family)